MRRGGWRRNLAREPTGGRGPKRRRPESLGAVEPVASEVAQDVPGTSNAHCSRAVQSGRPAASIGGSRAPAGGPSEARSRPSPGPSGGPSNGPSLVLPRPGRHGSARTASSVAKATRAGCSAAFESQRAARSSVTGVCNGGTQPGPSSTRAPNTANAAPIARRHGRAAAATVERECESCMSTQTASTLVRCRVGSRKSAPLRAHPVTRERAIAARCAARRAPLRRACGRAPPAPARTRASRPADSPRGRAADSSARSSRRRAASRTCRP